MVSIHRESVTCDFPFAIVDVLNMKDNVGKSYEQIVKEKFEEMRKLKQKSEQLEAEIDRLRVGKRWNISSFIDKWRNIFLFVLAAMLQNAI